MTWSNLINFHLGLSLISFFHLSITIHHKKKCYKIVYNYSIFQIQNKKGEIIIIKNEPAFYKDLVVSQGYVGTK